MTRRGAVRGAAAALALCWSAAQAAQAPGQAGATQGGEGLVTLQVDVTNVRNDRGHIRVAVCPRADFLKPRCAWHAAAPARAGSVTVSVPGLPPGVYAVQCHHDENDDGKINRTLLGMPTEGIGFSRDAPMRFGPPSFDDAAIRLGPADGTVSLRLRYFD